ncbi:MAG: DMT family transporter [Terriglobia bacterium]
MPLPQRLKADLALVGVSFIWGCTFVVVKSALADVSPLVFVWLRLGLASLLLWLLFRRVAALRAPGLWRAGAVIGFFLATGYGFQTVGLNYTTPAKSAFITALSVVLVPVLMMGFFRQRVRPWMLGGVAAAVAGLYFLTVPPGRFTMEKGDFLTVFCALAFAGHIVAVGRYASRYGFRGLAVAQVGMAVAMMTVMVPVGGASGWETPVLAWTGRLGLALVVTAVLATAVAFSVQTWAQQFTSPTHTAIIYSLEPVFAALTSFAVFGERLGGRGLLGAGLILAGVLLAELRVRPGPELPGAPVAANPGPDERV